MVAKTGFIILLKSQRFWNIVFVFCAAIILVAAGLMVRRQLVPPVRRWGYIDKQGHFVVEPRFIKAYGFKNGFAEVVVPNHSKSARASSESERDSEFDDTACEHYVVSYTDRGDLDSIREIDKSGHLIARDLELPLISAKFDKKTRRYTFCYVRGGSEALRLSKFAWAYEFDRSGLAVVQRQSSSDSPLELIDKNAKTVKVLPAEICTVSDHDVEESEGLREFTIWPNEKENECVGLSGFLNKDYQVVIQARFRSAESFDDGLACVVSNDKTNRTQYIDKLGHIVLELPENAIGSSFGDGLACVDKADRWGSKFGFINKKGQYIIAPNFQSLSNCSSPRFSEGLAKVGVEFFGIRKFGFIDRSGRFVIPPQFEQARDFSEGLAAASVEVDR